MKNNKLINCLKTFLKVFTNPIEAMKKIKDEPQILIPSVVISILAIIIAFISVPLVQISASKINSLMIEKYNINIPQAQTSFGWGAFLVPIGIIISLLISSFFLWAISKIFRGEAKFKQVFSLNTYSMIIPYVINFIAVPICLLLNTDVSPFSLAVLYPNGTMDSFLYDILYCTTLFGIWQALVVGVGLYIVNNFNKLKGYIISISIYVIGIIFSSMSMIVPFLVQNIIHK